MSDTIERDERANFTSFEESTRDDWAIIEDRTHLTRAETLGLFDQYILEHFEEEDRPSSHGGEHHKHWHVFHIVARKR